MKPSPQPTPQAIALRAYQLWEAAGRPPGQAVEHWLCAERQLQEFPSRAPDAVALPASRYGLVLQPSPAAPAPPE